MGRDHLVRLYVAEIEAGMGPTRQRTTDIVVNGRLVEEGFDIDALVGKGTGVVMTYLVDDDTDDLTIELCRRRDKPGIMGLEVLQLG